VVCSYLRNFLKRYFVFRLHDIHFNLTAERFPNTKDSFGMDMVCKFAHVVFICYVTLVVRPVPALAEAASACAPCSLFVVDSL